MLEEKIKNLSQDVQIMMKNNHVSDANMLKKLINDIDTFLVSMSDNHVEIDPLFDVLVQSETIFDALMQHYQGNVFWMRHYGYWLFNIVSGLKKKELGWSMSKDWAYSELKKHKDMFLSKEVLEGLHSKYILRYVIQFPYEVYKLENAGLVLDNTCEYALCSYNLFFEHNMPLLLKNKLNMNNIWGIYPDTMRRKLTKNEIRNIQNAYHEKKYMNNRSYHEELLKWIPLQNESAFYHIIEGYMRTHGNEHGLVLSDELKKHAYHTIMLSEFVLWSEEMQLWLCSPEDCKKIATLANLNIKNAVIATVLPHNEVLSEERLYI